MSFTDVDYERDPLPQPAECLSCGFVDDDDDTAVGCECCSHGFCRYCAVPLSDDTFACRDCASDPEALIALAAFYLARSYSAEGFALLASVRAYAVKAREAA